MQNRPAFYKLGRVQGLTQREKGGSSPCKAEGVNEAIVDGNVFSETWTNHIDGRCAGLDARPTCLLVRWSLLLVPLQPHRAVMRTAATYLAMWGSSAPGVPRAGQQRRR
jgi:hypothetical protein